MKRVLLVIFGLVTTCCLGILLAINITTSNIKTKPEWVAASFCSTSDTLAPELALNGESVLAILVGDSYKDPGATAVDDCDAVDLIVDGEVDAATIGSYTITYSAVDHSGNKSEVKRTVNVVPEYRGTIYLTFDDGPGPYTAELLDILAKYNVKATFFVTGSGDDALIAREYNEGHAIGLHTLTHNYAYIYQNTSAFFEDLYAVQERVKNITGYTSYLMRFPGGSSNTVSTRYDGGTRIMTKLTAEVERRGFSYFDWNISSGDAGGATTAGAVYSNVVDRLGDGVYVVLQHDVKGFSVAAVENIIKYGLANGYNFARLEMDSFGAHHRVNN